MEGQTRESMDIESPASDTTIEDPDLRNTDGQFHPESPASSENTVPDAPCPPEVPSITSQPDVKRESSPRGVPSSQPDAKRESSPRGVPPGPEQYGREIWRPYGADSNYPPNGTQYTQPLPPNHEQHYYHERPPYPHQPSEGGYYSRWEGPNVGDDKPPLSSTLETPPVQFPPRESYFYPTSHPSQEGSSSHPEYYQHVPSNSQPLAPPHAQGYSVPSNSQPLGPPPPHHYPNTYPHQPAQAHGEYPPYPPQHRYHEGQHPPQDPYHYYGPQHYPPPLELVQLYPLEYQRGSAESAGYPQPPPPPNMQHYPSQNHPSYPTVPADASPTSVSPWGVPQHVPPPPPHPLSREGVPNGNPNPSVAWPHWRPPPPPEFAGGNARWSQVDEKKFKPTPEAGPGGKVPIPKNTGTFFQAAESLRSLKKKERVCQWEGCNITKSPKWRTGPKGKGTLCNVHGLRYHYYENRETVNLRRREKYNELKKERDHDKVKPEVSGERTCA